MLTVLNVILGWFAEWQRSNTVQLLRSVEVMDHSSWYVSWFSPFAGACLTPQLGLIIMTAQLLSLLLRKLKQPRVIAEVLGGILLGPTALGRIPGFTEHIFPSEATPYLSLVANIGLVRCDSENLAITTNCCLCRFSFSS